MKINFQKIPLLISIILLVVVYGIFYLLYNKIQDNSIAIQEATTLMQAKRHSFDKLQALNNALEKIEIEKMKVDEHFIESSNLVPFLDSIEELAPSVGATAETTSVEISPDKASLLVGLRAEGSFSSLYKFFTLLENSPYEMEFISFVLSKKDGESNASMWDTQIKLKLISFIN